MHRSLAVLLAAATACGGPRFLGSRIGDHCDEVLACRAWGRLQAERVSVLAYEDRPLHDYVTGVLRRIVVASGLPRAPELTITRSGSLALAHPSGAIYVSRQVLVVLDSEAELAAVLAHELAHVEARTAELQEGPDDDPSWLASLRDLEAIADERAVEWMIAAGYAPEAMLSTLEAIHRGDDSGGDLATHPSVAQREAHVAAIIGTRTGGELGQERYRRHLEGMLIGDDHALLSAQDGVLVSVALDLAIDVGESNAFASEITATLMRSAGGDTLIARLHGRRSRRVAGHLVVTGTIRDPITRNDPAQMTIRDEALPQFDPFEDLVDRTRVLVIRGAGLDVWIPLAGKDADARLELLVQGIRKLRTAERARAVVTRLRYLPARIAGTYEAAAAATCAPPVVPDLDDATRLVRVGDSIKCGARGP